MNSAALIEELEPEGQGRELETLVIAALEQVSKPATTKELCRTLPVGLGCSEQEVQRVLDACVAAGRVFPLTTGKTRRYSHERPDGLAETVVLNALQEQAQSKAELSRRVKARIPGFTGLDRLLKQLTTSGRVCAHYKLSKQGLPSKTVASYALAAPVSASLESFVARIHQEFENVAAQALAAGFTREQLLNELLVSAGVEPGAVLKPPQLTPPPVPDAPESSPRTSDVFAVAEVCSSPAPSTKVVSVPAGVTDTEFVLNALRELASAGSAAVPIPNLRSATALQKKRFDTALLALATFGTVTLTDECSREALSLTLAERENLLLDRQGKYYTSVALRTRA